MSILLPRVRTRRGALRNILGGGAVTLALPFLDCHLSGDGKALAATGQPLPVRFGTWYWGMGHTPGQAVVEKHLTGKGIDFLTESRSLVDIRDQINFFGNFNMPLDGRANYTHWSGWVANRCGSAPQKGADIPAPTLDLLIADVIGKNSRFKTIDASCTGVPNTNYSARDTNSRAAAEISPLSLYARIFGPEFVNPNDADFKPDPRIMLRKSVLSAFMEENQAYAKTIGAADKSRLDEYFTSIRSVENQLALQLEKPPRNEACVKPAVPSADAAAEKGEAVREMGNVIATHKVMSKLMAMAVACNQTNVFNMTFTDHFGGVRRDGETYTHHLLTHEEPIDKNAGYQPLSFWFGQQCMDGWVEFLKTFMAIKEGDGTLLDNCMVFASSETNYARVHTIDGIPVYLAGKAGGRMKSGYHVVGGGDPITRVGFTALKIMGVPLEKWGTNSLQTSKPVTEIMA